MKLKIDAKCGDAKMESHIFNLDKDQILNLTSNDINIEITLPEDGQGVASEQVVKLNSRLGVGLTMTLKKKEVAPNSDQKTVYLIKKDGKYLHIVQNSTYWHFGPLENAKHFNTISAAEETLDTLFKESTKYIGAAIVNLECKVVDFKHRASLCNNCYISHHPISCSNKKSWSPTCASIPIPEPFTAFTTSQKIEDFKVGYVLRSNKNLKEFYNQNNTWASLSKARFFSTIEEAENILRLFVDNTCEMCHVKEGGVIKSVWGQYYLIKTDLGFTWSEIIDEATTFTMAEANDFTSANSITNDVLFVRYPILELKSGYVISQDPSFNYVKITPTAWHWTCKSDATIFESEKKAKTFADGMLTPCARVVRST